MEEFFEEAVDQVDPSGGIEEQYKLVNNPTFAWKTLRLLSHKSPYFFAQLQGGQQIKTLPQYLDHMIGKLAKEMQMTPADEAKSDVEESTMENGNADAEDEPLDNKDEDGRDEGTEVEDEEGESVASGNLLTKEILVQLSQRVCEDWKKLAVELGLDEDEIIYFEGTSTDLAEQASKMLTIWMENEGEKATVGSMQAALVEIGRSALASELFGEQSSSP